MNVVVATHGHCFDGLASAVTFTRLLRAVEPGEHSFRYRACGYGAGQTRPDAGMLSGDTNALLDFRLFPIDRLGWFFDHHRTGMPGPEERAFFEAHRSSGRFFFDADYGSCTKLILDVATRDFGISLGDVGSLVEWADRVDRAAFASAEAAMNRDEPVMQLVSVIEHHGDDKLLNELAPALVEKSLAEVAASKTVQDRWAPLRAKQDAFVEMVRTRGEKVGRAAFVDLTHVVLEVIGKFVTYALFPECAYSVVVARQRKGSKISVGYNPWSGLPSDHDVSAICARWGGGGHKVVGAIQFGATDLEKARTVARSIAEELGAPAP